MSLSKKIKRVCSVLVASLYIVGGISLFSAETYAIESNFDVVGNVYEFAENDHYEFSAAVSSSTANINNTFGIFSISGDVKDSGDISGISTYSVSSENVTLSYSFDQARLDAAESEWHLIDDKTKKVDSVTLSKNVLSGAIIVQSSLDGETWITDVTKTDVFTVDNDLSDPIYTTKEVQIENGCYYRVIVAYKYKMKTGENKFGPITTDVTEEKKVAEVYRFFVASNDTSGKTSSAADTPRKELGKKVNTGKDNGYSGSNDINKDDPHYSWDLGTFVVNGYTRETSHNGTPIFLKNMGDKVTLWFTLKQDINNLSDDSTLTIAEDTNGYDQYFEVNQTNFEHGTLIIRYTDHEGSVHDPIIYTDFLVANVKTGADIKVKLFEEGDYEVSLDYEIKNNPRQVGPVSVVPTYTDYKISFSFSIRNGNSMVYPFDTIIGAELSDNAITANGFKLDMAKSRYLSIDVTRTTIKVGPEGLVIEDVRFNKPAKDNDSYTDKGIYTFRVKNKYTDGDPTIKTIYVGRDKYLLALSKNKLTVEALNEKITQGAAINDDGSIVVDNGKSSAVDSETIDETKSNLILPFAILGSVVAGGIGLGIRKKKRNGKREDNDK